MGDLLACNLASYGQYRDLAFEHLASIGVRHVELGAPAPDDAARVRDELAEHGLAASSVMAPCPVDQPDLAERFKPVFEAANTLGANVIFVSAHAGETALDAVYERLRAVGDAAAEAGVKVALETHPDLCDNGAKMVETMQAIGHPAIGVNFDTANLHYYNQGVDTVEELDKAIEHIVAVHLKDTNGAYRTWHFPTLGQGIVDFPAVLLKLHNHGFHGPFTMELEGIENEHLSAGEQLQRVADSVAYLRGHGLEDRAG